MRLHLQLFLLALSLLTVFAGCKGNPPTAPVIGRVIYHGEPLPGGSIMFQPDAGPPGRSEIAADGTFELWTFEPGDGAMLGRHRVRVVSFDNSKQGNAAEEEIVTGRSLIPPWYEYVTSSGLEFTVEPKDEGEVNNFEIVLSDKRPAKK